MAPRRFVAVDYEFIPGADGTVDTVCGVATDVASRETWKAWRDEMSPRHPFFPLGPNVVLVAHHAAAEIGVHMDMGWPLPVHVIDTYAEHMLATNEAALPDGVPRLGRGNILAALRCRGLKARATDTKRGMIDRILAGPPYDDRERAAILSYCGDDVDDTVRLWDSLFRTLSVWSPKYLDQALVRGEFAKAQAAMSRCGCPIDVELHDLLASRWSDVRHALVDSVAEFEVFEKYRFSLVRFTQLLEAIGALDGWPMTQRGPSTKDDVLRAKAEEYPGLSPLREVMTTLGQITQFVPFAIGPDGRYRLGMMEQGYERLGLPYKAADLARGGFGAYRAKTGRSQPQAKEFLPARANWWRTLVTPPSPDWVIGYFDFKNQEFGYAAYMSGDANMIADYENGHVDPYVAFGHRSGFIPPGGTKFSHPKERAAAKSIVLGAMYGRQALSIGAVLAANLQMEGGTPLSLPPNSSDITAKPTRRSGRGLRMASILPS